MRTDFARPPLKRLFSFRSQMPAAGEKFFWGFKLQAKKPPLRGCLLLVPAPLPLPLPLLPPPPPLLLLLSPALPTVHRSLPTARRALLAVPAACCTYCLLCPL